MHRRHDVGDDRQRTDHQAACTHSLNGTERDQLVHRLGQPREDRRDEEDDGGADEDRPATQQVTELPGNRRGNRRGDEVGGDDPRQATEPAEIADDRGQRRGDDHLVESGEEAPRG